MGVLWNSISEKSNGGTELLCRRLEADLPRELLDDVQIVPSRLYGTLDKTKVRILYLHDLAHDPESQRILADQGWKKFHKLVFVSNWQMQQYIGAYNIPWSHCVVIPNSIHPIERTRNWMDLDAGFTAEEKYIRFIYHTTPHRGLDILVPVFERLWEEGYKKIHLDVYSSFRAYGWDERDAQFQHLFDRIDSHPAMTNHGFQPNDVIRSALAESDVFAYPNTWPETSCLALMEAMSAGLLCIHPNFGALSETAANWTMQYQFNEVKETHAGIMYGLIRGFLDAPNLEPYRVQLANQKSYADIFYNWNLRKTQWVDLIRSLQSLPRDIADSVFTYRTGP